MRRPPRMSGFTLVELMISVAIALLLVLGINTIFRISSQAVGAGESVLSCERDARTIMQTMLSDTQCVVPVSVNGANLTNSSPCFVIRSEHVAAFRNASEQQTATDQQKPYHDDFLFANINAAHIAPVPMIHWRSHRLDRLGLFAHGNLYPRQTSSDGYSFVATSPSGLVEAGIESWVTYGHATQPNKDVVSGTSTTDWWAPGDGTNTTNDHNYFAGDWMLARLAIVLNPNPTAGSDYLVYDPSTGKELTPLSSPSISQVNSYPIDSVRLDVANTSIDIFANLNTTASSTRANGIWLYAPAQPLYGQTWWEQMVGNIRLKVGPYIIADPKVSKTPPPPKISAYGLAKCSPNLIRGCSQFIVEYAGSYYTKDTLTGNPVDTFDTNKDGTKVHYPKPDGQIDYVIDPITSIRQIRWYGFPRSVINSPDGQLHPEKGDVVPLRDVLDSMGQSLSSPQPWGKMDTDPKRPNTPLYADAEHFSTNFPASSGAVKVTNYMDTSTMDPSQDQILSTRYTYAAAWGPDVQKQAFPKMIRIIVGVEDHEGRLNQPLLFEYVYDVQP